MIGVVSFSFPFLSLLRANQNPASIDGGMIYIKKRLVCMILLDNDGIGFIVCVKEFEEYYVCQFASASSVTYDIP